MSYAGELIEASSDEGEADDTEENVAAYEQQQREKLEQEKQDILNNKGLIAEVTQLKLLLCTHTCIHCMYIVFLLCLLF